MLSVAPATLLVSEKKPQPAVAPEKQLRNQALHFCQFLNKFVYSVLFQSERAQNALFVVCFQHHFCDQLKLRGVEPDMV